MILFGSVVATTARWSSGCRSCRSAWSAGSTAARHRPRPACFPPAPGAGGWVGGVVLGGGFGLGLGGGGGGLVFAGRYLTRLRCLLLGGGRARDRAGW